MLNEKHFSAYKAFFPSPKLCLLRKKYSSVLWQWAALEWNHKCIFRWHNDLTCRVTAEGLGKICQETVRLRLIRFPVILVSNERSMTVWKRVEKFTRNSITNSTVSNLSILVIVKALLNDFPEIASKKESPVVPQNGKYTMNGADLQKTIR